MKDADVVAVFSALGQPKRLEAYKLLLTREPHGLLAGDLARIMDSPFNTMSAHMAILHRAGLVNANKVGRTITYRIDTEYFAQVIRYLFKDCCDGKPELCIAESVDKKSKSKTTPKNRS